ncbi:unnamed protein product, partial [Allacma fusca]
DQNSKEMMCGSFQRSTLSNI